MFAQHDERQGKAKMQKLVKGAAFFQNLCKFYPNDMKKKLADEIAAIEAQIEKAKADSKQRQLEKLAEVVLDFENGKLSELAAKKNAKYEAELIRKIKAEVRREIESEAELKISEAKAKI